MSKKKPELNVVAVVDVDVDVDSDSGKALIRLARKVGKGYLDLYLPVGMPSEHSVRVTQEGGYLLDEAEAIKLVMLDPVNFVIEGREELSDTSECEHAPEIARKRSIPKNLDDVDYATLQLIADDYDIPKNQNMIKLKDAIYALKNIKAKARKQTIDLVNSDIADLSDAEAEKIASAVFED